MSHWSFPNASRPKSSSAASSSVERGRHGDHCQQGPGVRAVAVNDVYTAERAIASNNAQVITLGSLITGVNVAKMYVDTFLANEFQGGGSAVKVQKMNDVDGGLPRAALT